jgi:hypothetical protein
MGFGTPTKGMGFEKTSTRLIVALAVGVSIVLSLFVVRHPWQLNFVLAPGGITAIFIGFAAHRLGIAEYYGEIAYASVLLLTNIGFYSLLTYGFLTFRTRRHKRGNDGVGVE